MVQEETRTPWNCCFPDRPNPIPCIPVRFQETGVLRNGHHWQGVNITTYMLAAEWRFQSFHPSPAQEQVCAKHHSVEA